MPRGGMFFILLVILSVGLLTLLWPMFPSAQQAMNHKNSLTKYVKNNLSQQQQAALEAYQKPPPAKVSAEVLQEAARAGSIDPDPLRSEKRLDELAHQLTDQEIQSMAEIVKTPSNNGDLRALAVDLLARSKAPASLEPLEKIIISQWPLSTDPRMIGFEQSLRARAIEGLESHPSEHAFENLQNVLSQTNDSFLSDHAHRAMLHRQGQARSVEEQDQEALRKILKR